MDKLWIIIGIVYGLGYLAFGICCAVIDIRYQKRIFLALGTAVVAIIGAAGVVLYCCRIHNETAMALWKFLVIPYVLLNLGIIWFKARNNCLIHVEKSSSMSNEVMNALLIEGACLYFNLKYAFFFQ